MLVYIPFSQKTLDKLKKYNGSWNRPVVDIAKEIRVTKRWVLWFRSHRYPHIHYKRSRRLHPKKLETIDDLLRKNPTITIKELVSAAGISKSTAHRYIVKHRGLKYHALDAKAKVLQTLHRQGHTVKQLCAEHGITDNTCRRLLQRDVK
jgi:response regulator of citrate/malate metabolism